MAPQRRALLGPQRDAHPPVVAHHGAALVRHAFASLSPQRLVNLGKRACDGTVPGLPFWGLGGHLCLRCTTLAASRTEAASASAAAIASPIAMPISIAPAGIPKIVALAAAAANVAAALRRLSRNA